MERQLSQLEAIVFHEGAEVTNKTVMALLEVTQDELERIVQEYNASGRGIVIVKDEKKLLMRVAHEHTPLIEQLDTTTQTEELSKAALEVLAIVLYSEHGSLSASEVEHIRGVNSGYTLRQLTMRGLLSKKKQGMSYQYMPTAELLSFLGVTHLDGLPDRAQIQQHIHEFKHTQQDGTQKEQKEQV